MTAQLGYRKRPRASDSELIEEFNATYEMGADGIPRWRKSAHGRTAGKPAGHDDGSGYLSIMLLGQRHKLHRIVWLLHHGSSPSGLLDHINGDKRDNRIENLREATHAQNVHNRIKRGRYRLGVSKNARGRFCARIQVPGVAGTKIYLGYYDTEAEAAAAYAGAAIILHGEYAAKLSRAA